MHVEVIATTGTLDSTPFQASHVFLTNLRTTQEAMQQLVREHWSMESWHWIRDTKIHGDKHRYGGNGAGVMAALHTATVNLLRLVGFD